MIATEHHRRHQEPRLQVWLLALALAICDSALATSGPKPLFASEAILKLRIEAPFDDLIRTAPGSTKPYEGKLTLLEPTPEIYSIHLSARGIFAPESQRLRFPAAQD